MNVVIMDKIPCSHCGIYFIPDPRQKNQRYCSEKKCQQARKSSWQQIKMKSDPVYRANQKQSQADWLSVKCHDIVDKKRCHNIVEFVL